MKEIKILIVGLGTVGSNVIKTIEKGNLSPEVYHELIDVNEWTARKYYYSILTNETRMTKSFMIIKPNTCSSA